MLRSVAEIDRVLPDGGFLLIGDFYPSLPQRVRYHHLPDQDVFAINAATLATQPTVLKRVAIIFMLLGARSVGRPPGGSVPGVPPARPAPCPVRFAALSLLRRSVWPVYC